MVANKSLSLNFPYSINKDLYSHFIRGIFDGDGSIMTDKKGRRILCFNGSESIIKSINIIVSNALNIKKRNLIKVGSIWRICYCGYVDMASVINYLYKDAHNFLNRKKEKADKIIEDIDSGKVKPLVKTSQYKGIFFDKSRNRWSALNSDHKLIGRFKTEEEALYAQKISYNTNNI